MSVAKVIEIVASSDSSFDDAIKQGVAEASRSLRGISGLKVVDWTAKIDGTHISSYKVTMHVAFKLESER